MTGRRIRRPFAAAAAFAALLVASGCGTATIEDAVPVSTTAPTAGAATPAPTTASGDASTVAAAAPVQPAAPFARPGDFPNLNVVPQPAATQITSEEKEADFTLLQAIRAQQEAQSRAASGDKKTTAAELRRIGRSHASDALKEIEGEQP
jgi:hypothetical protein